MARDFKFYQERVRGINLNQFCSLLSVSLLSGGKVLTKKEVKGIGNLLWRRGGRLGEGEGEREGERSFSKHTPILII